jgi:predicted amidohydrolase
MLKKIIIIQCRVGRELTLDENLLIHKHKPDIAVLPEYFNVDPDLRDPALNSRKAKNYLDYCRTLSDRLDIVLIAGTAIEAEGDRFYNASYVYDRGRILGRYRKINPTENEQKNGISPGTETSLFEAVGIRFSILICADVLYPENFVGLKDLKPDIIFVPTTSPLRPRESNREKFARDNSIFVSGAKASGSYIVKCCAVGKLWQGEMQGRSLVAAPWGILERIAPKDEDKERILSVTLNISELREFRKKSLSPIK